MKPDHGVRSRLPRLRQLLVMTLSRRLKAMGSPKYQRDGDPRTSGPGFGLTLHPASLEVPQRWSSPRLIFVNSMSDLFHESVPLEFIAECVRCHPGDSAAHSPSAHQTLEAPDAPGPATGLAEEPMDGRERGETKRLEVHTTQYWCGL